MVKIGFICEGFTEFRMLNSQTFKVWLASKHLEIANVINAKGAGNLLPLNIAAHLFSLERSGAQHIIILTDLDTDTCITFTKQRIKARTQDIVVIAVKKIEAWLLADTKTMRQLLKNGRFHFEHPEIENNPFETIRKLKMESTGSGVSGGTGGKLKLLDICLSLGLSIESSANHPNCPSAAYFVKQLNKIAAELS